MIVSPHLELSPTWQILLAAASCGAGVSPAFTTPPRAGFMGWDLANPISNLHSLTIFSSQPFPHARKKPDITLRMLQALKLAYDGSGRIECDHGTRRRLLNRGLARLTRYPREPKKRLFITGSGRILIRTQYDALLKVLTDDLTAGEK